MSGASLPTQPASEAEDWQDSAQVVGLHRHRLEPAAIEVAIVMREVSGRYTHRRVRCVGYDLGTGVPHLFDADPEALARAGEPTEPRLVSDLHCDSLEQALEAAYAADPPADPKGWMDAEQFGLYLHDDEGGIANQLHPEARKTGLLGALVVFVCVVATFAGVAGTGYVVNAWLHLDQLDGPDTIVDNILSLVLVVIAGFLALMAGAATDSLVKQRNLARAVRRSRGASGLDSQQVGTPPIGALGASDAAGRRWPLPGDARTGRWPTITPPTVRPTGPPIFHDGNRPEPLVVGTRVRVVSDPDFGPGPWTAEPSGRIAVYPGADAGFVEVETRWGPERSWWVVFDEPQVDADGDGPYRESEVLERYLQVLP